MKKVIALSVFMVLMLLVSSVFTLTQAQNAPTDDAPTFYHLVPGTYVNGWPRFTLTYPKDWVERTRAFGVFFQASNSRRDGLSVAGFFNHLPLDKYVDFTVPYFKRQASEVTVVSNKPSRLRDGTPAWELEMKMIMNGVPMNWLAVASHQGGILVSSNVFTYKGTIGEDLRAIAYSIQFDPGRDRPVQIPFEVRAFLDDYCATNVSHDITKVVGHFSDRYLNTGMSKGKLEQVLGPGVDRTTSCEIVITDFVPQGEKAYLTGFVTLNLGKGPIAETSIIKENGVWKWYGNQRIVAP